MRLILSNQSALFQSRVVTLLFMGGDSSSRELMKDNNQICSTIEPLSPSTKELHVYSHRFSDHHRKRRWFSIATNYAQSCSFQFLLLSLFVSLSVLLFFFKKNGTIRASFCPVLITISIKQYEKSIVGVLGIQTQGRRMVGADETTELWRPPPFQLFVILISLPFTFHPQLEYDLFLSFNPGWRWLLSWPNIFIGNSRTCFTFGSRYKARCLALSLTELMT